MLKQPISGIPTWPPENPSAELPHVRLRTPSPDRMYCNLMLLSLRNDQNPPIHSKEKTMQRSSLHPSPMGDGHASFPAPETLLGYMVDFDTTCPTPRGHQNPSLHPQDMTMQRSSPCPSSMGDGRASFAAPETLLGYMGNFDTKCPTPRRDQNPSLHPQDMTMQPSSPCPSSMGDSHGSFEAPEARLGSTGVFDIKCPTLRNDHNPSMPRAGQSMDDVPSAGSVGHPLTCRAPCKYYTKARGCLDGAKCDRCHLCSWRPSVEQVMRNRKRANAQNHGCTGKDTSTSRNEDIGRPSFCLKACAIGGGSHARLCHSRQS